MLPQFQSYERLGPGCCTVDGRNPAPVDMVDIPLFTGFHAGRVVVWDFFNHQYLNPRSSFAQILEMYIAQLKEKIKSVLGS